MDNKANQDKLLNMFASPSIIGLVGDPDQGKSSTIYWIVKSLREKFSFNLYTYGLKIELPGEQKIYSVEELEKITQSVVILDEFASMLDLDDRKQRRMVEKTLRTIFHNRNTVLLCGLPENMKKFVSNKLQAILYKQCSLGDFINGSRVKKVAMNYGGDALGAAVLKLAKGEVLFYDGDHYQIVDVPYDGHFDTKKNADPILCPIGEKRFPH